MNVLLLSAYAAKSHVHWQRCLVSMFADWQWQVLSLPPRHFSWRVRGNPLYWALEEQAVLEGDYQLLIATSMVDLSTLRGLVPKLAAIPTVLYFHENQFAYPQGEKQQSLLEAQMVSLYSALAADTLLFNSQYNRDSFMAGCDALLKRLPDRVPAGIVSGLQGKTAVLPVPLPASTSEASTDEGFVWSDVTATYPSRPLRLLWVGRFEYDKGPEGLWSILQLLEETGINFELAMVGQQFRSSPAIFDSIQSDFSHRLVQFGYLESAEEYGRTLDAADMVLSTALHEFQGIAVLEAVARGCLPVVPDRLAYPEIFPASYCYGSYPDDLEAEAREAVKLIVAQAGLLAATRLEVPCVSHFQLDSLKPRYESTLLALAGGID
ncbi:MAG: DUF3524 domain-containing protein [Halioglobus sp.]